MDRETVVKRENGRSNRRRKGQIYDVLYGFIRLTETEEAIINSPYYQRLRWIKQLGFANYIFDGAEHTRFAHAIGVLHTADQMVRSLGKNVSDEKLFDNAADTATLFHKSIRIAALLHDIGTFPFSHSIEGAYIRYGESLQNSGKLPGKQLPSNHEHLGSFIIKNTGFKGGISRILEDANLDSATISRIIKGDSDDILANQILHSDIDADRMDYLLRDAHHTGIKYGHIDRDYILHHLSMFEVRDGKSGAKREVLAVKENALHAVEDFLIARFSWYSQVVRNSSSAKYDILAAHIAHYLLEHGLIHRYAELFDLVVNNPERFFGFNDVYFMSRAQDLYWSGAVKDTVLHEQLRMLIYRIPPRTLRFPECEHRILDVGSDGGAHWKTPVVKKLQDKIDEINELFRKHGSGKEWIIADVPVKDVIFTKDAHSIRKGGAAENPYSARDPIKVVDSNGRPTLLVERENSLVAKLSRYVNFIPNVYANEAAYELLKARKFLSG